MRILVVGAGALGGYFGGRLKEAGRDVTFLVRPRRAEQLARTGLIVRSPKGDIAIAAPPTVLAENLHAPFDLILLSCKAYDLQGAMDSFAPAVGADTAILPLLNGMKHMDLLAARFGAGAVLGGQCIISATLNGEGRVLHLNDMHFLSFGEQNGSKSPRVTAIAAKNGFKPGETAVKRSIGMLTAAGSPIAASMLRDIERGAPIEADHIIGDLSARGGGRSGDYPLLQIAYAHLRTYEARRQREQAAAPAR